MLGTITAPLDGMMLGPALPVIMGELGGLEYFSWVATAYLICMAASTPIWGKVGDLRGRKPVYLAAIVLFLLGSGLSGMSQDMIQLVGFRAVQGLGAGGLMVGALALIAELVPPRLQRRPRHGPRRGRTGSRRPRARVPHPRGPATRPDPRGTGHRRSVTRPETPPNRMENPLSDNRLRLPVIVGSVRDARIGSTVATWFATPSRWRSCPTAACRGGLRAVEHLRTVFAELHAVTRNTVSFHGVWECFDGDGRPKDPHGAATAAKTLLDQVTWWARVLHDAKATTSYTA
ncbi:MFS transporter [Amycolatopsis sp. NPDC051128]|uniref:MFS transporter n=1 Tax=Amycolatopsis sp. NPDC051128 TaxID=3155412 RepID=UPI0034302D50